MPETLVIHTCGSKAVGHGHVTRSLALGAEAQRAGLTVCYAPVDPETDAVLSDHGAGPRLSPSETSSAPFIIRDLPGGSDPAQVRAEVADGAVVMLLDDTGPARCEASLVVDAMMTPERANELPHGLDTRYLYGLEYTTVRPEIRAHAGEGRPGRSARPSLVVGLGSGFPDTLPFRLVEAFRTGGFDGDCEVLLTRKVGDDHEFRNEAKRLDAAVSVQTRYVGACLARADLLVTKLGISLLEGLAVGVGAVLVEPTPAHLGVQEALAQHYQSWPVHEFGLYREEAVDSLVRTGLALLDSPAELRALGERARTLVDGRGASRVIAALRAERA